MIPGNENMMGQSCYSRFNTACIENGLETDSSIAFNLNNNQMMEINNFGQNENMAEQSSGPLESLVQQGPPPQIPHQRMRRKSKPQSEENFQRALEAVRFGGIGFCKAARLFGVNNRTLWLEYKKRGYTNNRMSIKKRIKTENNSPPPDQQTVLLPQQPVPMIGFIDSRQVDYPNIQSVNAVLGLHSLNFNTMQ